MAHRNTNNSSEESMETIKRCMSGSFKKEKSMTTSINTRKQMNSMTKLLEL